MSLSCVPGVLRLLAAAALLSTSTPHASAAPRSAEPARSSKKRPKKKPPASQPEQVALPADAATLARGVTQALCAGDSLDPLLQAFERKRSLAIDGTPAEVLEAENARIDAQLDEAKRRVTPRLDAARVDRMRLATLVHGAPPKLEAELTTLILTELKSTCAARLASSAAFAASSTPARAILWALLRRL